MDLTNLVTQENAEEGKWFQVSLYGKKQKFEINILGSDSDTVQKFQREQFKKINASQNSNKKGSVDDETLDELLDNSLDNVIVRMNGLRAIPDTDPLMLNGTELVCDEKSYRLLVEKIPAVKDFVLEKSNERANFLSAEKKN